MGDALRMSDVLQTIPDTWLSVAQVAGLLEQSERTVRTNLVRYITRQSAREGSGGTRHEILLASLPVEALARWEVRDRISQLQPLSDSDLLVHAYERADQRTRRHFDRWSQILLATDSISGRKDLESWVAQWNTLHQDAPISVQSLYRVRAQVREQGRIGLLLRDTKLPESTVRDEWFQNFASHYLNESKPSAEDSRRVAFGKAFPGETLGPQSQFPSVAAFLRRLEKKYSPAMISFGRDGEKKYFDRHGFHIRRDYSDVIAGRIWVGDTREIDVLVRVDGRISLARPYVTLFICMKSWVPMGWHLHLSAPSAENSMRALHHGIKRCGKPSELLLDNGRENKNRELTGITRGRAANLQTQDTGSVAALLGITVHFAEVFRSRTKPIEPFFRQMKNHFDKFWPSFTGGNAVEKPTRLKEVVKHPSEIPTFEELSDALNHFYMRTVPQTPSKGATHKGRTRAEVLLSDIAAHGDLPRLSDDTLSMLVSKLARGTIGPRGFHLAATGSTWYADWMPLYKRRKAVLRYVPEDLSTAWCYEATESGQGKLWGTCTLIENNGAMIRSDDAVGLERSVQQNRFHKREIKDLKKLLPQSDAAALLADREAYASSFGSRDLEIAPSNTTVLTGHDRTAAQVRRDGAAGKADYALFVTEPTVPARPPLRWHDEPISAAG